MRIRDIPYLPWIIAVVILFSIVNVLVRPQSQSNTVAIDENQTVIVAPTSVAQTYSSDNQEVSNNSQVNISTDTTIVQLTDTAIVQPTSTVIVQPTITFTAQDDVVGVQTLAYKAGMELRSFEDYREAVLDAIRQRQTIFAAEYVGSQNELADIYDAIKNYYHPRRLVTLVAQSETTSPQIRFQL